MIDQKPKLTGCRLLAAIACNYFPLLHAIACILCIALPRGWGWKTGAFLGCLYLLPVVCTRLALAIHPIRRERIELFSADYWTWWFTFCTQVTYARLPFLEEALRTVPSLYSFWLRLWGAKIGKLVYWAPQTLVLDRPFVRVGDHASLGLGARLCPHVHAEGELWLSPVVVGGNVVVGAYSLLAAGTVLEPDQATKACLVSPPFSVWKDGRRIAK